MYTRCPSCRAEISFEPPANLADLPEGYKHRIKCPSCGVTIGVKIPRQEALAQAQPTYTPAATSAAYDDSSAVQVGSVVASGNETYKAQKAVRKDKKSGRGRNLLLFILSAIVVAVNALAYLKVEIPYVGGSELFDGIGQWALVFSESGRADIAALFAGGGALNIIYGIFSLLPLILFTLAGLNALIALISFIGGKYSRAYNFVFGLLFAAAAVLLLFAVPIGELMLTGEQPDVLAYFQQLIADGAYMPIIIAGIGVIYLIFVLIFLKSLKRNPDAKRPKRPKKA